MPPVSLAVESIVFLGREDTEKILRSLAGDGWIAAPLKKQRRFALRRSRRHDDLSAFSRTPAGFSSHLFSSFPSSYSF
jgi:hypothetical protein